MGRSAIARRARCATTSRGGTGIPRIEGEEVPELGHVDHLIGTAGGSAGWRLARESVPDEGPSERPETASPRGPIARGGLDKCQLECYYRPIKMPRRQLELILPPPPTWGGRRQGAGRNPTPGRRPGVAHRTRPHHRALHPVHVTLRAHPAICCLRAGRVFPVVRTSLAAGSHP